MSGLFAGIMLDMAAQRPSVQAVHRWREQQEPRPTIGALSALCGDRGNQIYSWLSGARATCPMRFKARLALHMGVDLVKLCDRRERALVRDIRRAL